MMFKLGIPDEDIKNVKGILDLEAEQREAIITKFRDYKPAKDGSDLEIIEGFKDYIEIFDFLKTIFKLFLSLIEDGLIDDIDDFISQFVDSFLMKTEEEGIEYRDKIPLLEQFLIEILNTDTQIYYFEKAKSLLRDRSKLIVDMRILSDLRPVFKDDKIEPPEYCVITHNLRITYIKERERKKAIFALDQEDLSKLQLQIKRALEKDSELHTIAKKSGLEVFEVI